MFLENEERLAKPRGFFVRSLRWSHLCSLFVCFIIIIINMIFIAHSYQFKIASEALRLLQRRSVSWVKLNRRITLV